MSLYLRPTNSFYLNNGREVTNLVELALVLHSIEDSVYAHHVTNERNDFANWVTHCMGDEKLAKRLSESNSRKESYHIVRAKVRQVKGEISRRAVEEKQMEDTKEVIEEIRMLSNSFSEESMITTYKEVMAQPLTNAPDDMREVLVHLNCFINVRRKKRQ